MDRGSRDSGPAWIATRAIASARWEDVGLAIETWLFIATIWTGSLWLDRGTWRPVTNTTRGFVDVSIRRCQSAIAGLRFAGVLYLARKPPQRLVCSGRTWDTPVLWSMPLRRVIVCEGGKRWAGNALGGLVTMLLLPALSAAQDTRAGEIAQKQEEKAASSQPYTPTRYEKIMTDLENSFVSPPSGIFPYFGSVYPGGGFTLGAGYRHFYAREAVWEVKGLYSIKNYKNIEVGTRTPWNYSGRWATGVRAGWRDATQVGFYGLGQDTTKDDRANSRLKWTYVVGELAFRPSSWTRLEAELGYDDIEDEGGSGSAPSIETVYNPTTAPGLFQHLKYIRTQGTAAIDWRVSPGYSRTGGFYGVTFTDFADQDNVYSFQRVDGELIQHLPIFRETWVLSFHGRVQSVLDDDDNVPYYLMPYLGSGRTLRAYSTGRFRDRNALLTTAEFRWIPSRLALDMAIFYDAGKVASRFKDLDFNDMKSDWGVGVRFHGPTATVLRIEAAKGTDGWHLVISTNAAF